MKLNRLSSILRTNQKTKNKGSLSLLFYQPVKDFSSLSKLIVSASVSFTSFTGYVVAKKIFDINLFLVLLGVFLLAAGASAINQIIERKTDRLMPRTQNRPLPSNRMTVLQAILFVSALIIIGSIILIFSANIACLFLGFFNIIWYNAVYTPFKKVSVWAVFAGTITGIIPFFMGVVAATNSIPNHTDYFIGFYMFLWQIPHFFLLVCKYGKEYEQAGLASATQKLSIKELVLISYVWMIASCIASMLIPLFGITKLAFSGYSYVIISIFVLVIIARGLLSKEDDLRTPFITTNIMQTAFMLILILDTLIINYS